MKATGTRFAAQLLARLGRQVIVPWPILTEVDLLLRARSHPTAARVLARAVHDGAHRLTERACHRS